MCGRYFVSDETEYEVEKELNLEQGSLSIKAGDVTPATNPIVLTVAKAGDKQDIGITDMFWGFMGKDKKLVINARAESAQERSMFADSIGSRRCIIPAAGFYEWDKDKNKVTFFRQDMSPIYLAGIYQLFDNKDSFVILTTAANDSMIRVHDRMPLMIDKSNVREWLYDKDAAFEMMKKEMPMLGSRQEYEQLSLF